MLPGMSDSALMGFLIYLEKEHCHTCTSEKQDDVSMLGSASDRGLQMVQRVKSEGSSRPGCFPEEGALDCPWKVSRTVGSYTGRKGRD